MSIDSNDFGKLPSPHCPEYSYYADTDPPVLKTALLHFLEHPDHAPRAAYHRPRIPKRVGGRLNLVKAVGSKEGYGIYLQEGIAWVKVIVLEVVFATFCLLFAIIWCIRNQGGIQDGFAMAGVGIAYSTVFLGMLQVFSQRY